MSASKKIILILLIGFFSMELTKAQVFFDVEEIRGPICVVRDTVLNQTISLSPEISKYNVVVTDGLAYVELSQMYINPFEGVSNVVYVFPLPHEASVHDMAMEYKGNLYPAVILERDKAQDIYDSIVDAGGNAALLLQNKPNIFQQQLANIPKGDTAYIRIGISMPLKYESGEYELALPTMIGGRYGNPGEPGVGSLWNPPEDRDGHTLKINILMQTGFNITNIFSPLHPIESHTFSSSVQRLVNEGLLESEDKSIGLYKQSVFLKPLTTYPNRDFILRFSRESAKRDFSVASYYDLDAGTGYFAASLFPDDSLFDGTRPPGEFIILVDISGSQGGWPLVKEKEIANLILNKLKPTDQFSLASFNTSTQWAFGSHQVVDATSNNITSGIQFVESLNSGGGTELLLAVNNVLSTPLSSERERYFILLTDGFITNEQAIFEVLKNHPSNPSVITFGAGNNLNRYFLDEAANIGNGFSVEVTSGDPVTILVNDAWDKLESPQLTNISIEFTDDQVYDLVFPLGNKMYIGSPLNIYGKYTKGGTKDIKIVGYKAGERVEIVKQIHLANFLNINQTVPKIWAKNRIVELTQDQGLTEIHKDSIISVSLEHQILSQYTAFLASVPVPVNPDNSISDGIIPTPIDEDYSLPPKTLKVTWNGFLNISFPRPAIIQEIVIYDLMGRVIFRKQFGNFEEIQTFQWDGIMDTGEKIKNGKYLIQITTASDSQMIPFMVWR